MGQLQSNKDFDAFIDSVEKSLDLLEKHASNFLVAEYQPLPGNTIPVKENLQEHIFNIQKFLGENEDSEFKSEIEVKGLINEARYQFDTFKKITTIIDKKISKDPPQD